MREAAEAGQSGHRTELQGDLRPALPRQRDEKSLWWSADLRAGAFGHFTRLSPVRKPVFWFMQRENLQRLDVNRGHEPEGAMGSAGVSPAGFGVPPNPRGSAPGCFRSARRRPVQPGGTRSPFKQPQFMGRGVFHGDFEDSSGVH